MFMNTTGYKSIYVYKNAFKINLDLNKTQNYTLNIRTYFNYIQNNV